MIRKLVDLPYRFGLLHHTKQIAIRLVFMCYSLTFCLFLLSSNSIHKQYDNNPSGSRQITYLCTWLNYAITNSDIRRLNPLNVTLLTLSHTDRLLKVLICIRWSENWSIYRSGLSYFTMVTELTNTWYFGAHLLPKAWDVCNVTEFHAWNDAVYEDKIR